jgi:hypothetical protein
MRTPTHRPQRDGCGVATPRPVQFSGRTPSGSAPPAYRSAARSAR